MCAKGGNESPLRGEGNRLIQNHAGGKKRYLEGKTEIQIK